VTYLLRGDLTDYGLPEEAYVLAKELATVRIPTLAVFGNHDYESGKHDEVQQILTEAGIIVLNGDAYEVSPNLLIQHEAPAKGKPLPKALITED
jgi:DNA repair exonuclease SbcCD nuclease subunit